MTALDFLKSKGLIKDGFTEFVISGEFGQIELTKLLKEYAECINDVSQQRELLPAFLERKDFDIITLKTAGTSVLKDWEEYLKAVNCG